MPTKAKNTVCCSVCRKIQKAYAWCTELSASRWCCKTPLDLDCLKRITGPNTINMLQRTAPLVSNHRHCIDSLLFVPSLSHSQPLCRIDCFPVSSATIRLVSPSPHVHETLSL